MDYAIIVSEQDPASMNIKECLLELYGFKEESSFENHPVHTYNNVKLYSIEGYSVFAEKIDKRIDADFFIFATRHQSKEGIHSLSCHAPGNWSKAEFGGVDKELCAAPAFMLKRAYLELEKCSELVPDHQITMEVTHHGPFIEKPVMFIEIGSTDEHWGNRKAGEIIAHTIIKLVEPKNDSYKSCILLGGGHYNQIGNKLMARTDYAIGHICPKYALEFLNEEMLKKAIERTVPRPEIVVLDWKGMGQYKQGIVGLLEKLGLKYEKAQRILK
ncbi:MAG: hypothetical protein KAK00_01555 [Nanoarchaeota archaeon]|nr:hypothetical protein [Nanoarchaeota archaeon]